MKIKLKGRFATKEVWLNDKLLSPEKSQEIYNHSPDGFNWGYGGSGPAQLALAILLELYDRDYALAHHQSFKWLYVERLHQADFETEIDMTEYECSFA